MLKVVQVAEIVHNSLRVYCAALGEAQPLWHELPQDLKDSVIAGIKIYVQHPFLTAEQSHWCWMQRKYNEGWQYGTHKSVEGKIHPLLRPWKELPTNQRVKDHLFKAIINSLMAEGQIDVTYPE